MTAVSVDATPTSKAFFGREVTLDATSTRTFLGSVIPTIMVEEHGRVTSIQHRLTSEKGESVLCGVARLPR